MQLPSVHIATGHSDIRHTHRNRWSHYGHMNMPLLRHLYPQPHFQCVTHPYVTVGIITCFFSSQITIILQIQEQLHCRVQRRLKLMIAQPSCKFIQVLCCSLARLLNYLFMRPQLIMGQAGFCRASGCGMRFCRFKLKTKLQWPQWHRCGENVLHISPQQFTINVFIVCFFINLGLFSQSTVILQCDLF